jgi:hypothetical protein
MSASAGAIRMGQAFVEIFSDDSKLVRGLRGSQSTLTAFGSRVAGIGAKIAGVTSVIGVASVSAGLIAAKQYAEVGASLDDMSQRTGASVDSLSRLSFAAEMSGTSLDSVEGGLRKMQGTIAEAASGSKSAQESLAALGVSVADLEGLSPDEQMRKLADGVRSISDPAQRTAAVMGVFGKSGADLIPLLAQGGDAISQLGAEADRLGVSMSGATASGLATLDDKLTVLSITLKANVVNAVGALAGPLTTIADVLMTVSSAVSNWVQRNQSFVLIAAGVVAAVVGIGAAIASLGLALTAVGFVAGTLATAFAAISAAFAFVASPIGIVIVAVSSLGFAFFRFTEAGREMASRLSETFQGLKSAVMSMVGGIGNALAAGDIALAGEVLWAGLRVAWHEGTSYLLSKWGWFKAGFLSAMSDVSFGFQAMWSGVFSKIEETIAYASHKIAEFVLWVSNKAGMVEDYEAAAAELTSEYESGVEARAAGREDDDRHREARKKKARVENERGAREGDGERERVSAQLRQQYYDKLGEAREAARKKAEAAASPDAVGAPGRDVVATIGKTASGSFSAAALAGLAGGGGAMERTAKATEQTSFNTKQILKRWTGRPAVFGR